MQQVSHIVMTLLNLIKKIYIIELCVRKFNCDFIILTFGSDEMIWNLILSHLFLHHTYLNHGK